MKMLRLFMIPFIILCVSATTYGASHKKNSKHRILVISSYHKGYSWSTETHEGLCAAMLKLGYFDDKSQVDAYTKNDYIETSKMILKKLWMDSKRKDTKNEMAWMTMEISQDAKGFKPDLIFLGDDDAANYIGNQFLDSKIPMVFWGINNTPIKYGLVNSEDRPGHNVTGVYQPGYFADSLGLLKTIVPGARTFAILSDDSSTGRSNAKAVEYLARKGALPLKLSTTVVTTDYEVWKSKALELQKTVDAFFMAMFSSLKDKNGNYVSNAEVAQWYLTNIKIPEATVAGHFVKIGMFCAANDSGFNQGFDAFVIAHDILAKGANPATYPIRIPRHGALMVNKQRAGMLGITLTKEMGIEEYIEEASVLKNVTQND